LFAREDFCTPAGSGEARSPFVFWILLLMWWTAPAPGVESAIV